ncbi:MAG: 3-isopropylmalate dehydrogenase [Firmicutes bacterium]|nr:3-isopropylmalate dehydrogenase [Bacillota bacterium]
MAKIVLLPGDGIGTEIMQEAVKVLEVVGEMEDIDFQWETADMGGVAIDEHGTPLPDDTLDACREADGVLLGAVGGPKWDDLPGDLRPEAGLLGIRRGLGLFANLRPARVFNPLVDASSLKAELAAGVDILVVRELTGGLYFGRPRFREETETGGFRAVDTLEYTTEEIRRIALVAFEAAQKRRQKVTSVDKSNILESSRLWREVVGEVAREFPSIECEHMFVDNCAMQLLRDPKQFDVILTTNMFGDILSDEAAMLTGSLGMLPSASIGGSVGLYEPVHGSAPTIAGQDIANPLAMILSAAMLLQYSLNNVKAALRVEKAVEDVLRRGYRTQDIWQEGMQLVGTKAMGDEVAKAVAEGGTYGKS